MHTSLPFLILPLVVTSNTPRSRSLARSLAALSPFRVYPCTGRVFAVLEINSIETRLLGGIDAELARTENFEDAEGLKLALARFYPNLTADSEVVVVHFKLIRSTLQLCTHPTTDHENARD